MTRCEKYWDVIDKIMRIENKEERKRKLDEFCKKHKVTISRIVDHYYYVDAEKSRGMPMGISTDKSAVEDLPERATRELRKLKRKNPDMHDQALSCVLELAEPTAKQIKEEIRKAQHLDTPAVDSNVKIQLGDIKDILKYVKPNTVDLILTDPPYPKEYLPLWSELSEKAAWLLKPNGLLITYSGHAHLPEVYSRLSENLEYVWTMALLHKGAPSSVFPVKMFARWKPIIIYKQEGAVINYEWRDDIIHGAGREKEGHEWQQALGEAEELIRHFTQEGALVVDPFAGSGTTILAAKKLNRNFFGMDTDELSIKRTLQRLENE